VRRRYGGVCAKEKSVYRDFGKSAEELNSWTAEKRLIVLAC